MFVMSQINIDEVSVWTDEQCQSQMQEVLPRLIDKFISSEADTTSVELLRILFTKFLSCSPFQSVESSFFSRISQPIIILYERIVLHLRSPHNVPEEQVYNAFQNLFLFVDCLVVGVTELIKLCGKSAPVEYVQSFPIPVLKISLNLYQLHEDCKRTESSGNCQRVEFLDTLFTKTTSLTKAFIVLWENLVLRVTLEDDVVFVLDVCSYLKNICSYFAVVAGKAPVALWKTFISTLVKCCDGIRDRVDVASTIQDLCSEVCKCFEEINSVSGESTVSRKDDEKMLLRSIQMAGFYLKIITTLCEKFKSYLGDCFKSLLHLVLTLYRFSTPSFSKPSLGEYLESELEKRISVIIEPLVLRLITEDAFVDLLIDTDLEYRNDDKFNFSFCLLHIFILGNLSQIPDQLQRRLMAVGVGADDGVSLLHIFFDQFSRCCLELCFPVYLPGVMCHGKPQRMISLYEHLCTRLCGAVATFSSSCYKLLERILIKNLLSGNFWRSLLAADVWSFLGRLESATLCFHHCCFISELVLRMSGSVNHFSYWIIPLLLRRLYCFLTPSQKLSFNKKYPLPQFHCIWIHLYSLQTAESSSSSESNISGYVKKMHLILEGSEVNASFGSNALLEMYFSLCALTENVRFLSGSKNQEVVDVCLRIWRFLPFELVTENSAVELCTCQLILLTSNLVPGMQNSDLLEVLKRLLCILCHGSDFLRYSVLKIFASLGRKEIKASPEQMEIFQISSLLLSKSLGDKNVLLMQKSLEAFSRFSHLTCHEAIISQCLDQKPHVQKTIRSFLKKVPFGVSEKAEFQLVKVLSLRCSGVQKVESGAAVEESEDLKNSDIRPSKQSKLDRSVLVENDIKKSVEDISNAISKLKNLTCGAPATNWLSYAIDNLVKELQNIKNG